MATIAAIGVAEPRCGLDDHLEDGLQLRRCTTDNAQDLARRSLVFKGLLQLARARLDLFEETGVLDCYHCLVREGLEKSDLLVRKGRTSARRGDRADRLVLAHQRGRRELFEHQDAAPWPVRQGIRRRSLKVVDVNRLAVERRRGHMAQSRADRPAGTNQSSIVP